MSHLNRARGGQILGSFTMRDTPADNNGLGWPLSGRELDDVDILELARDDGGQLTWQNRPPPGHSDSYREWMPKRRSAAPDHDLPLRGDMAPGAARHAEAAPSPETPEPQPMHGSERAPDVFEELLPTRLDMGGAPPVSLSDLLPDLWPTSDDLREGPAAASPAEVPASEAIPPRPERTPGFLPMTAETPLPSHRLALDDRGHVDFADWEDAGDVPLLSRPHDPPALASTAALAAAAAAAKTTNGHHDTTSHAEPAGVAPGRPAAERVALLAAGVLIGTVVGLTLATREATRGGTSAAPAAAVVARGPETPAAAPHAGENPQPDAPPPARPPATERSAEAVSRSAANTPAEAAAARAARPLAEAPSGVTARSSATPGETDAIASTAAGPSDGSGPAGANQASEQGTVPRASRPAGAIATVAARSTAAPTRPSARVAPPAVVPVLPAPPSAVAIVREYAAAYSRLDARAAQALWPTLNREALVADFSGVREQRLTLTGCKGQMVGVGAAVTCDGTLRYRPRVGDHSTRLRQGVWRFALAPAGDSWRIDLVTQP